MHEFREWPKTKRLFRDITVTEKLDGTNAAIHITALTPQNLSACDWETFPPESYTLVVAGTRYVVNAQSRTRLIYPGKTTDNFGFAAWVYDHAAELVKLLGEGVHFGEWWGQGIQRGYGMGCRHFSLFNTDQYAGLFAMVGDSMVQPVPVLYQGPNDTAKVDECLRSLAAYGSVAVSGWAKPEGVCIFHSATRQVTKATLDANDAGKWEVSAGA
ncbi:RNA ligase family protein [Streptomyces sp. NPDC003832]